MKYQTVKCSEKHPEIEGYYDTDEGKLYYYFIDDWHVGWCTNESRPMSYEYPSYWLEPIADNATTEPVSNPNKLDAEEWLKERGCNPDKIITGSTTDRVKLKDILTQFAQSPTASTEPKQKINELSFNPPRQFNGENDKIDFTQSEQGKQMYNLIRSRLVPDGMGFVTNESIKNAVTELLSPDQSKSTNK